MSKTLSVYSAQSIDPTSFGAFIGEVGGFYFDDTRRDVGISRGDATVWIYEVPASLAGGEEEVEPWVETKLGGAVKSRIDLQLSSAHGSERLALEVALAFVTQWPSSLAITAVHRILDERDLDAWAKDDADVPTALGRGVDLLLTSRPAPSEIASEFGGLILSEASADQEIAQQWMREMNLVPDAEHDCAVAFVTAASASVCITAPVPCSDESPRGDSLSRKIHAIARNRLNGPVRWHVELMTGWGAGRASAILCLALARRFLRDCKGVGVGLFETVLYAKDIARLCQTGAFIDG